MWAICSLPVAAYQGMHEHCQRGGFAAADGFVHQACCNWSAASDAHFSCISGGNGSGSSSSRELLCQEAKRSLALMNCRTVSRKWPFHSAQRPPKCGNPPTCTSCQVSRPWSPTLLGRHRMHPCSPQHAIVCISCASTETRQTVGVPLLGLTTWHTQGLTAGAGQG